MVYSTHLAATGEGAGPTSGYTGFLRGQTLDGALTMGTDGRFVNTPTPDLSADRNVCRTITPPPKKTAALEIFSGVAV